MADVNMTDVSVNQISTGQTMQNTKHFLPKQSNATGLPPGWEVRHSQSKNLPYYFNPAEKNSRWEPPSGTDIEKLKLYMARYHSTSGLVTDGPQAPGKIRALHLLVKHNQSRRPSSWREVNIVPSSIT
jgi:NIMA-interacting peptidyl-prolyl cis-trans isomerase 1